MNELIMGMYQSEELHVFCMSVVSVFNMYAFMLIGWIADYNSFCACSMFACPWCECIKSEDVESEQSVDMDWRCETSENVGMIVQLMLHTCVCISCEMCYRVNCCMGIECAIFCVWMQDWMTRKCRPKRKIWRIDIDFRLQMRQNPLMDMFSPL